MKKLMIIFILLIVVGFNSVHASSDYQNFEKSEIIGGKFLKDFTESEYQEYYKKLGGRKFNGWSTYIVHDKIRVKYVCETIFSYYNDGTSEIKYETTISKNETSKQSISASGSIGISVKGDIKKFKNSLDAQLKFSYDTTKTTDIKETTKMSFTLDPRCQVTLKICGEGNITNGVGIDYTFWIIDKKGGFEIFNVTTQYQRLEIIQI